MHTELECFRPLVEASNDEPDIVDESLDLFKVWFRIGVKF